MKFIFKKHKGFTIIELVVSIFILSVALVGIFSAFSVINILTSDSSDRLTGIYLAQEGLEIVRNIRDTNWLNMDAGSPANATWLDELDCTEGCEADYTTGTSISGAWPMNPWTGRYLYTDTDGFYVYNTNNSSKTKFERKIIITPVTDVDTKSDHIINVKTQVSWDQKANILNPRILADTCSASNCITVEETLYDWYNYVNQ